MGDEDIELAKEHLNLAEGILSDKMKKEALDKKAEKEYMEAQFALERAQSEIDDIEELDKVKK